MNVRSPFHVSWDVEPEGAGDIRVRVRGQGVPRVLDWLGDMVPARVHRASGIDVELVTAREHRQTVEKFLRFAAGAVPVVTNEVETWACEPHSTSAAERSEWGDLVYRAKPYDRAGDRNAAVELGARLAARVAEHPAIGPATAVIAVPDHDRKVPYSLPAVMAREVACHLATRLLHQNIRRVSRTVEIKHVDPPERAKVLRGVFEAVGKPPSSVLIVDDVVQTGATVGAVASVLRSAGDVRAIAATFAKNGIIRHPRQ